jgi:hypothetical protein
MKREAMIHSKYGRTGVVVNVDESMMTWLQMEFGSPLLVSPRVELLQ